MRIDLVGTTADFRRFWPPHPLHVNHLLRKNSRAAGRIGEVRLTGEKISVAPNSSTAPPLASFQSDRGQAKPSGRQETAARSEYRIWSGGDLACQAIVGLNC